MEDLMISKIIKVYLLIIAFTFVKIKIFKMVMQV